MLCNGGLTSAHNLDYRHAVEGEGRLRNDDAHPDLDEVLDEVEGDEAAEAAAFVLVFVGFEEVLRQSPIRSRVSV